MQRRRLACFRLEMEKAPTTAAPEDTVARTTTICGLVSPRLRRPSEVPRPVFVGPSSSGANNDQVFVLIMRTNFLDAVVRGVVAFWTVEGGISFAGGVVSLLVRAVDGATAVYSMVLK